MIKTATCLGGAVLLVADAAAREAMVDRQRRYPVQPAWAYAAKLAKAAGLLLLTSPAVYGVVTAALERLTGDYDQVIRRVSRGFDDRSLIDNIRRQPSAALLTMMARRLSGYDPHRLRHRTLAGEQLASRLDPQVEHLGGRAVGHTHWLFPVISRRPDALVTAGREAGFDLTRGASTLVAVDRDCVEASRAMRDVVYLPAYHPMPAAALARLAEVVNTIELRSSEGTPSA
jgi:dTDP-4-amino-4,6-dideoxygalactose transaminase